MSDLSSGDSGASGADLIRAVDEMPDGCQFALYDWYCFKTHTEYSDFTIKNGHGDILSQEHRLPRSASEELRCHLLADCKPRS
jgi:hypothetical protein